MIDRCVLTTCSPIEVIVVIQYERKRGTIGNVSLIHESVSFLVNSRCFVPGGLCSVKEGRRDDDVLGGLPAETPKEKKNIAICATLALYIIEVYQTGSFKLTNVSLLLISAATNTSLSMVTNSSNSVRCAVHKLMGYF
ncbi:hypothetical protein TNCV_3618711 [Trichonephila clavipes]|nr:hypothetical protein TNCV_3618711 [Trichonephila clavipes]